LKPADPDECQASPKSDSGKLGTSVRIVGDGYKPWWRSVWAGFELRVIRALLVRTIINPRAWILVVDLVRRADWWF